MSPSQRFSWQVNKLLKLSSSIYGWVKLRVQNGHSCRFWSDNWSPFAFLRTYLGSRGSSNLGIPNDASLASLNNNGYWSLPPARSDQLVNLHAHLTTVQLNTLDDYYEWEVDGIISDRYSSGIIYDKLREEGSHVPWYDSVWNKAGIPRHNFLSWLFTLDRCPTRDRTIRWGHQTSPLCLMCNNCDENRNHLFFLCQYSWTVWESAALRCGIQPERTWDRLLLQLASLGPRSTKGMLLRLCWQGCIYWIWMERNARLHRQTYRSPENLTKQVERQIKDRISSLRSTTPAVSSRLMQRWLS